MVDLTKSVGPRHIDQFPLSSPRPVEMQVLCLGLSRTSTMSLTEALNKLGYKTYHFREIFITVRDGKNFFPCWEEALRSNITGEGKMYGREEFDKILGEYSALTDAPCVCFVDELLAAYPDAKVILGTRDPDKWLASMENSYYRILGWNWFRLYSFIDPIRIVSPQNDTSYLDRRRYPEPFRSSTWFLSHNEHVRSVVPKENLLEFRPEQGWKPLCQFLGKEVPSEPYPRVNEGNATAYIHMYIVALRMWRRFGMWLVMPLVAAGFAWGLSRYR